MRRRLLHILILFTGMITSTAIMPATLVAGLLTFPTTCTCGADQPHEHPLFGVAGHHHGGQHVRNDGPHDEAVRVDADGVNVQTPTGSATPALTAIPNDAPRPITLPQASVPNDIVHDPHGIRTTPDVPPPRA